MTYFAEVQRILLLLLSIAVRSCEEYAPRFNKRPKGKCAARVTSKTYICFARFLVLLVLLMKNSSLLGYDKYGITCSYQHFRAACCSITRILSYCLDGCRKLLQNVNTYMLIHGLIFHKTAIFTPF